MQHLAYRDLRWEPQPGAEQLIRDAVARLRRRVPAFDAYAGQLRATAGVRARDIADALVVGTAELEPFRAHGWSDAGDGVLTNPDGLFPAVLRGDGDGLWLRVESVDRFVAALPQSVAIEGAPFTALRRAVAFRGDGAFVGAIERNGTASFQIAEEPAALTREVRLHHNAFRARRRQFGDVEAGLAHTQALVDRAVAAIGPHRACDAWLKAEREFWMRNCHAGRVQKARQDAVGIGWANIDHHTYDSSRAHFRHTVRILETLGYELREMLYAGEMAGWGSQVLWQPAIGSTIFADVDLSPEELGIDFAHAPLPPLRKHRRAGLLSDLLGESILEAGLNHVAGLFDQRTLRDQLGRTGVAMMAPFSDMAHLYQELTAGDWAAVDPARVDALQAAGHIDPAEAEKLRLEGSIVTHLENIERNDGFKGFNRDGIDGVLRKLDPRAYHAVPA